MSRAINKAGKEDEYSKRLVKNIPTEIVGVYLAASAYVDETAWLLWVIFGLCLVAVPFWMYFMAEVKSALQISLAVISFIIWIMSIGGPFASISEDISKVGSALIVICSGLIFPFLSKLIKN